MIPSAFLVAVVFLSCSYVVRCNVHNPCNATVECANNMTICENNFCHIQADQECTIETTTTVATAVTTPAQTTAGPTQSGATSQAPSSASAPTTTASTDTPTTTADPSPTAAGQARVGGIGQKRRKRNTGQQECVSNASCLSGKHATLACACNAGYTADNGLCKAADPYNGAGHLRTTVLSISMVTTILLFLI